MFYIIILINLAITIYNLQLLKLFSATIYHILLDTLSIFVSALHLLFNDSFFYLSKRFSIYFQAFYKIIAFSAILYLLMQMYIWLFG